MASIVVTVLNISAWESYDVTMRSLKGEPGSSLGGILSQRLFILIKELPMVYLFTAACASSLFAGQ